MTSAPRWKDRTNAGDMFAGHAWEIQYLVDKHFDKILEQEKRAIEKQLEPYRE